MRSSGIRYSALVLGILVAVSAILSYNYQAGLVKVKAKIEHASHDNSDQKEAGPILSVTSLPSPTVIHFSHAVVCLFEIVFVDTKSEDVDYVQLVPDNKFFSTLLSVIISPNAP